MIGFSKETDHCGDPLSAEWRVPGLLQTCKTIRHEASAIHYGSNTCNFRPPFAKYSDERRQCTDNLLSECLGSLSAEDRKALRTIRLDDSMYKEEKVEARGEECRLVLDRFGVEADRVEIFVELGSLLVGDEDDDQERKGEWIRA